MLLTVPQTGRPGIFFEMSVQVFPPSRVIWTRPSFRPAQMHPFSSGDSAMAKTTHPYSTARLSRVSPPEGFILVGSLLVRSGLITSQLRPASVVRWTYWLPAETGLWSWVEMWIGEGPLRRYM